MRLPRGFSAAVGGAAADGGICHVTGALYGLRQSPRVWHATPSAELKRQGWSCADDIEPTPFSYGRSGSNATAFLVVYVDDLLITAATPELLESLTAALLGAFAGRDLGYPSCYLGIQFNRDERTGAVTLHSVNKINALAAAHGFKSGFFTTEKIPVCPGAPLSVGGEALENNTKFASLVGSLRYIANTTRADIAFVVGRLARFMRAPTQRQWQLALQTLAYLALTPTAGLTYRPGALGFEGYSDASFLGDSLLDGRSTSGGVFFAATVAVLWFSRLQDNVSLSVAEAEYVACCEAAGEGVWLQNLFAFFGERAPLLLKVDNLTAMAIASSDVVKHRSRHIAVRFHYVRDLVQCESLFLHFVGTKEQRADILTKILPEKSFGTMRALLGIF